MSTLSSAAVMLGLAFVDPLTIKQALERDHALARLNALNLEAELIDRLMRLCDANRQSFELDKRLAQIIAKGEADRYDVIVISNIGPGALRNFRESLLQIEVAGEITWPDFLIHLSLPSNATELTRVAPSGGTTE